MPDPAVLSGATLRIGRPVADLDRSRRFYVEVLGFRELFRSPGDEDRGELQLVGVGPATEPWHLELLASDRAPFHPEPSEEELLVFFVDHSAHRRLVARLDAEDVPRRVPTNPFWRTGSTMFEDPDGYVLVVSSR